MEKISEVCKKLIVRLCNAETADEFQAVLKEALEESTEITTDMTEHDFKVFATLAAAIDPAQYLIFTAYLMEEYK